MKSVDRPLRVFLCHSSNDKPAVRELYQKLRAEAWIEPWLDEEELYPGQDWNMEIEKAVEAADAIIVCLTKGSITKEGYVQRELRIVLDFADYKPEGTIYILPVRLEECEPPRRLRAWQHADYFEGNRERALQRLLVSLKRRAESLDLTMEEPAPKKESKEKKSEVKTPVAKTELPSKPTEKKPTIETPRPAPVAIPPPNKLTLSNSMDFMRVPAGKFLMGSAKENKSAYDDERPQHTVDIPYDYWMSRFPVTNAQYNQFRKKNFDKGKENHPVVEVTWNGAMEYCQWLNQFLNSEFRNQKLQLRLPTEAEWEKAARGTDGREFPWGNQFYENKCNTGEGGKVGTTSVGIYSPHGDSPYGCADMSGNVWEWTHSKLAPYPYNPKDGREDIERSYGVLRGGSFFNNSRDVQCTRRRRPGIPPPDEHYYFGFRVVMSQSILSL